MRELARESFDSVWPLFESEPFAYQFLGVLAGNSPAQVWTDGDNIPTTAYMWDGAHCHYLVGRAKIRFAHDVRQILTQEIGPAAIRTDSAFYKVYGSSSWLLHVDEVFRSVRRKASRTVLTLRTPVDMPVPRGMSLRAIDESLFRQEPLSLHLVQKEIQSTWLSLQRFFERGFGYCLLVDGEIASWCTAEYVSDEKCGFGVETIERFQNKGYATVVAAALSQLCLDRRLAVYWDSWTDNIPSISVAKKVGFEPAQEYEVALGTFA